jgi:hemerythrin-like metal-binding protein
MTAITWSEALALELPAMDDTHKEFVALLSAVQQAPDDGLLAAWDALLGHTEVHFGQEDAWMATTGFASSNCHTVQHEVVLRLMRDALQRARAGELPLLRLFADELAEWFPTHAQTMDAALALHLRSAGMDPLTGALPAHVRQPQQRLHGCGGSACSGASAHPALDSQAA